MPTYSVKDNTTGETILVEAGQPAGAVRAVIADRYTVAGALSAEEALDALDAGATRLKVKEEAAVAETQPTPCPVAAFTAGMEDCDKAAELPPLGQDVVTGNDA